MAARRNRVQRNLCDGSVRGDSWHAAVRSVERALTQAGNHEVTHRDRPAPNLSPARLARSISHLYNGICSFKRTLLGRVRCDNRSEVDLNVPYPVFCAPYGCYICVQRPSSSLLNNGRCLKAQGRCSAPRWFLAGVPRTTPRASWRADPRELLPACSGVVHVVPRCLPTQGPGRYVIVLITAT